MQPVVVEKPYRFHPPYLGRFWPWFMQRITRRKLRNDFGVVDVECRGVDRLKTSLAAGHGILLALNHCRPCDPLVVNEACRHAATIPLVMASWHLFAPGGFKAFLLRRAGAFSVYREGMDRQALAAAVDILNQARRPLLIFPEGVISRHNDRLNSMMDGTSFVARSAAKKRAEQNPAGQVVVHPVALRYHFRGNLEQSLHPVLDEIERRFCWRPKRELDLFERIYRVGESLMCLKEIEYLGQPQQGAIPERLTRLIDHLLMPLETEWLKGQREATTVSRVKRLRMAILPEMIRGEVSDAERDRRWRQLGDMYLAQQLSCYPPDYIKSNPTPERLLETVERFEEDTTDSARVHGPMAATVEIGEAIPVAATRDRGGLDDTLIQTLEQRLQQMLGISS
ncbi:MAG TPA: 1-acyl-sn-glycerol-3-phosphate acyltransferase [Planctomycetaceae bacterium]|nr:1-acyl-sn-glycerol-3-phosphate acyltransferase [Planctomycetaceae bacterium]